VRALIDVDVDRDRGAESLGSDSDWANKRESKMPKEALYFFDCATKSSTNSRLRGGSGALDPTRKGLDREVLFEVVAEQQTKSGGEYRSIAIERSRKSEVV
jgi:hypothetical protein